MFYPPCAWLVLAVVSELTEGTIFVHVAEHPLHCWGENKQNRLIGSNHTIKCGKKPISFRENGLLVENLMFLTIVLIDT